MVGIPEPITTILVVEDDPDLSSLLEELLHEEGFEVFVARTGKAAFGWLGEHVPSLIVLDLLIPDMAGWEFDERRRRDPRLAYVPVVVTSGLPEAAAAASPVEAVARLPKPYRIEDLFRVIRANARPGPLFDVTAETAEFNLDDLRAQELAAISPRPG